MCPSVGSIWSRPASLICYLLSYLRKNISLKSPCSPVSVMAFSVAETSFCLDKVFSLSKMEAVSQPANQRASSLALNVGSKSNRSAKGAKLYLSGVTTRRAWLKDLRYLVITALIVKRKVQRNRGRNLERIRQTINLLAAMRANEQTSLSQSATRSTQLAVWLRVSWLAQLNRSSLKEEKPKCWLIPKRKLKMSLKRYFFLSIRRGMDKSFRATFTFFYHHRTKKSVNMENPVIRFISDLI